MSEPLSLRWVAGDATPQKVYITRVVNMGTWEEWKEMMKENPMELIEEAIRQPLRGQWTKHGKAFAEVVFACHLPEDVLISYDA